MWTGCVLFPTCRCERRSDSPLFEPAARRSLQIDQAWHFFLANRAQENAAAVEKSVCLVDVCPAYREVPGVDLANHRERLMFSDGRRLPGVFVDPVQAHALAGGLGMDRDDVPGEVTNQVTAGNPGWQGKALAGGVALGPKWP